MIQYIRLCCFFFNVMATTEIYTLSLHDALPIFAVGTPSASNGAADLSAVFDVVAGIGRAMDRYKVIVVKSTVPVGDRKSTRLNSSHTVISYAVFCLKKKNQPITIQSLLVDMWNR